MRKKKLEKVNEKKELRESERKRREGKRVQERRNR